MTSGRKKMARAFTQYFKNTTWKNIGDSLVHTASNVFRKHGVKRGDRIFIVTNITGAMYLGCVLTVDKAVGQSQARAIFRKKVWEAADHVLARDAQPFHRNLRVPQKAVRALRFDGNTSLVFKSDGKLDQQTLRGVRQLTPESAEMLGALLTSTDKQNGGGKVPKAGSNSSSLHEIRNDPNAVRGVFDGIFDSLTTDNRRRWETFLADSIEYAASKYEDRWVALLEPTYIRVTVGMVRCLHLWEGEDEVVLLSRADAPAGTRWSGGEYVYARGCEEAYVARSAGARLLGSIREAHFRAIDACGEAHAGNNQRRRAHSPGVLRYLEGVLGRNLPNPSYAHGASKGEPSKVTQPVEDPALESHPFADELAEELSILVDAELSSTEKAALIVARRGQGVFRENVLCVEPRCRVTGVTDAAHLRASHIKPWRDCSNGERLSENNGLMLAPHADHLFDRRYISFTDAGELLVSKFLNPLVLRGWGLTGSIDPKPFSPKQCVYFDFHRNQVFERHGRAKESSIGDE
jgi:hypothetical protein